MAANLKEETTKVEFMDRMDTVSASVLAGALSLAVGIGHATVVPEHLSEWWGYGFFFMLAALGQITYGLLLFMRPWAYDDTGGIRDAASGEGAIYARRIYLGGAAANLAIVGLYVITRTLGIPFFGPGAGQVEPVTALSLGVTVMEVVLALVLLALARRTMPARAETVQWDVER